MPHFRNPGATSLDGVETAIPRAGGRHMVNAGRGRCSRTRAQQARCSIMEGDEKAGAVAV